MLHSSCTSSIPYSSPSFNNSREEYDFLISLPSNNASRVISPNANLSSSSTTITSSSSDTKTSNNLNSSGPNDIGPNDIGPNSKYNTIFKKMSGLVYKPLPQGDPDQDTINLTNSKIPSSSGTTSRNNSSLTINQKHDDFNSSLYEPISIKSGAHRSSTNLDQPPPPTEFSHLLPSSPPHHTTTNPNSSPHPNAKTNEEIITNYTNNSPSTPTSTSFKVSKSDASDLTNDTSPSSIEDNYSHPHHHSHNSYFVTEIPSTNLSNSNATSDITTASTLPLNQTTDNTSIPDKSSDPPSTNSNNPENVTPANNEKYTNNSNINNNNTNNNNTTYQNSISSFKNKILLDIDPLHQGDGETPKQSSPASPPNNINPPVMNQILNETNGTSSSATASSRRHTSPNPTSTTPVTTLGSLHNNNSQQDPPRSQPLSHAHAHTTGHASRDPAGLTQRKSLDHHKPPISRATFPSYNKSSSNQSYQEMLLATNNGRQQSHDSTSTEILRMRNSILVKRNMRKKRKEFLEDEKVLVGNKISEGHENFVMAYNMLTGIRVAVSRCSGIMKKINDEDFKTTKKLSFNMDGSELTPSSKYDFKFKDYCPEVFRELRSIFGLDPADYLVSITGKYILSELGSPGKSGSFFYYSRDYRFIIKTIHHSEHKQLRRILKDYYEHVKENPNTLVSQFYGLHRVKMPFLTGSRKVHFIVMNNLFPPHRDIHLKYDLKGSTWGRITKIPSSDEDPSKPPEDLSHLTLKDMNFLERHDSIKFGPEKRQLFFKQLEADVKLLKKINVMDYSLLLGVHDVKQGNTSNMQKLSVFDPKSTDKYDLINTNPRDIDRQNDLPSNVFPGRSKYVFYGHDGGIRATDENNEPVGEIYYLGIIDCLTNYSTKKRLETFWRSMSHTRSTISALPAHEYGDRFLKFIKAGTSKGTKQKQQ